MEYAGIYIAKPDGADARIAPPGDLPSGWRRRERRGTAIDKFSEARDTC
jgi:hypothetical protein